MGVRTRFQFQSFRHLANDRQMQLGLRQIQEPGTTMSGIDFKDVVGCQLKIGGQSIAIFGIYLTSEVGIAGMNVTKLIPLGTLLQSIKTPWLVIGDFNATPIELQKSGWPSLVDGLIRVPSGSEYTCTAGQKRMIDYAVLSRSM
eukprot:3137297-Pyramimonas_sp.AAC.1